MDDMIPDPVSEPAPLAEEVPAEGSVRQPLPTGPSGMSSRRNRRRLILLAILLTLLALFGYALYYFLTTGRLPIPGTTRAEAEITPPVYLFSIVGQGESAFGRPTGLAVANDRVYVVDFRNGAIRVFDLSGKYLFSFDQLRRGKSAKLKNPVHMSAAPNGDIWVTDRYLREAYVFDKDGRFLRIFTPQRIPDTEWAPLAISVDATGEVYFSEVSQTLQHRIMRFSQGGKQLAAFGKTGQVVNAVDGPGEFYFPDGIVAAYGLVFISDGDNRRVQVYDPSGKFQFMIPTEGVPRGIAVDSSRRLYVANALAHEIDVYDLKGKALTKFGAQGYGPGQFNYPNDVAVDKRGRIYITDRGNHQVQVWGWADEGPPLPKLPSTPKQWAWCLSPLLLLLLPLAFRRRRLVVTEDFIVALAEDNLVPDMVNRRWMWLVPEAEHPAYVGRVVNDVDLGHLLHAEPHSATDANALMQRLGISEERAILLSIAQRRRILFTEEIELARLAAALEIDVYDRERFLREFRKHGSKPA